MHTCVLIAVDSAYLFRSIPRNNETTIAASRIKAVPSASQSQSLFELLADSGADLMIGAAGAGGLMCASAQAIWSSLNCALGINSASVMAAPSLFGTPQVSE